MDRADSQYSEGQAFESRPLALRALRIAAQLDEDYLIRFTAGYPVSSVEIGAAGSQTEHPERLL